MATRPFPADTGADEVADGSGRLNHHQLTVLAASPADVVGLAGGWLFDKARAGWDVNVWVADAGDRRSLTIVGAGALDGDTGAVLSDVPVGSAVAVTSELLGSDARVRAWVLDAVKRTGADVTVLGRWPAELGGPVEPIEVQCSVAALAFKARAMAAASSAGVAEPGETMYELHADSVRRLYPV